MCVKKNLQRLYILTHIPVDRRRPFVLGIRKATPETTALFKKYTDECERTVKEHGGGGAVYLYKRDIERWGCMPPVGARVSVVEVEVPRVMV